MRRESYQEASSLCTQRAFQLLSHCYMVFFVVLLHCTLCMFCAVSTRSFE